MAIALNALDFKIAMPPHKVISSIIDNTPADLTTEVKLYKVEISNHKESFEDLLDDVFRWDLLTLFLDLTSLKEQALKTFIEETHPIWLVLSLIATVRLGSPMRRIRQRSGVKWFIDEIGVNRSTLSSHLRTQSMDVERTHLITILLYLYATYRISVNTSDPELEPTTFMSIIEKSKSKQNDEDEKLALNLLSMYYGKTELSTRKDYDQLSAYVYKIKSFNIHSDDIDIYLRHAEDLIANYPLIIPEELIVEEAE